MSMSDEQARAECRRLVESGFDVWLTKKLSENAIYSFSSCKAGEIEKLQIAKMQLNLAEIAQGVIRNSAI